MVLPSADNPYGALGRADGRRKKPRRRGDLLPSRHTVDTRKEKMEEAESNTLASLRSGAVSIPEAIAVELPDVFAVEVLSKVDLRDTLSLAQVSKRYRDAVWSVDGVRSLQAKIDRLRVPRVGPYRVVCLYGRDAMACAIASNNLPAIRALLKSGREVEEEVKYDVSVWHVENTWNPHFQPNTWGTPLMFAAFVGHLEAVRVLIEAGADINKHATFHSKCTTHSALRMACVLNRLDVVKQLIKAGADVNAKSITDGTSTLVMAVGRGYEAYVALLINAGADVSERTLIDRAERHDRTNILKMLKCARSW